MRESSPLDRRREDQHLSETDSDEECANDNKDTLLRTNLMMRLAYKKDIASDLRPKISL